MIVISLYIYTQLKPSSIIHNVFLKFFNKFFNHGIRNDGHFVNRVTICYKNNLDIILLIWIVMSCFLSLWFTSELLTLYSTKRAVPLVQSLKDIVIRDNLLIGGIHPINDLAAYDHKLSKTLLTHLYTKKDYPPKDAEMKNIDEHSEPYTNQIYHEIMRDITRGRIVYLYDTDTINYVFSLSRRMYSLYSFILHYYFFELQFNFVS